MTTNDISLPEALLRALRGSRRIAVLTGAGISAESGVPTFRDTMTGLWSRYAPEDLATPEAFRRDPKLVWGWYEWRRGLVAQAMPNAGHRALVELERRIPGFTLITQNVDGLHRRAGSRRVLELHGNITRNKCFDEGTPVEGGEETGSVPPRCPRCGSYVRPDVVWFGEMLPEGALEEALEASRGCELFLSVGTSALVQPAASLPFEALRAGARVLEVNPDPTPLTPHANWSLRGPAGTVLPELLESF
ncbi:MAG TPA: NAD-dependent deacylase [Burkholderiales bacterium]|nr:NAD-dependent deacylase [Burkholderiales bacterium]